MPSPGPNSETHCCPLESTSGWSEAEQELKERQQLSWCPRQAEFLAKSKKGHVINDSAGLTGSSGLGCDSGAGRSLTDAVEAFYCELVQSVAL